MSVKCPKCHTDNPSDSKYCKECATQLPSIEGAAVTETMEAPREELTRGTTFAERYEIIEELGKGGMGRVYRVEDIKLKQEVALKLIKPEIAKDKKTIERFRNELKTARKIRHKNVCGMYDLGEDQGTHYITMEYVRGEDLKRLIRKIGQLSAGQAIPIAMQICEGLAEAHELGFVHRDLKPQNVMVDEEGNARIMDFGIARSLEAKGITGAGVMIGTPEYMSPEQVEGKEIDQRSDIYSLGIILYEMVTGRVPFEGDTPFTIGVKHKSEIPTNPKELNTQIPEDFNRVILRCLEKDQENRYRSAGELRAELETMEKGIPTTEKIVPKRKPLTSKEITVTFGLKKLWIPAAAIIVVVIIAIAVRKFLPKKEAPFLPTGKPSLAVMYFENTTGDESLNIWRSALSDLLISDLSQSKYIRVLPRDRLFGILGHLNLLEAQRYSSENLKEVASMGGASHILQGILTKAGENFRINTSLQESSTLEIVGSDMVEGKGEESFHSMVDELTRRIKGNFKLATEDILDDIDKPVEKITTSSPEAYKYYVEGEKYHSKLDEHTAIQFYKRAVAIDSKFASAYRSMAAAYGNLGNLSESEKYRQKAFELSDRVSDRESYQIQTDFYRSSEETYDKAIQVFNKLLELYPDDMFGNNNLGVLYRDLEEWDKAIEVFEVLIKNKDISVIPYVNQAVAYQAKGLYDKARKVLEDYLNNFSDSSWLRMGLAETYFCQGKYELALVETDKVFFLDPDFYLNFRLTGDIYHCKGDMIEAEREYKKLLEIEDSAANFEGIKRFGALYLLQGRFKEAQDQLEQGIEKADKLGEKRRQFGFHLDLAYSYLKARNPERALEECNRAWSNAVEAKNVIEQRYDLHYKGLSYLELKAMDEAQGVADELRKLIERGKNKRAIRYYHHLVGQINLKRKKFYEAIECFEKALSLIPSQYLPARKIHHDQALFIDSLALAYFKAGDLEKAQENYEKIASLTVGRLNYGDIYVKSYYMLGKISEQQGDKAKAIENYEKFLDLWKNADPGLPEVDDARKRLAGLKSQ
jgi:serine/threonine protein kinase/Tfp pilus assembly protein PilF